MVKNPVVYKKGSFLAVYNESGSFYFCKLKEVARLRSKVLLIQWLERHDDQEVFYLGDEDKIPVESVIKIIDVTSKENLIYISKDIQEELDKLCSLEDQQPTYQRSPVKKSPCKTKKNQHLNGAKSSKRKNCKSLCENEMIETNLEKTDDDSQKDQRDVTGQEQFKNVATQKLQNIAGQIDVQKDSYQKEFQNFTSQMQDHDYEEEATESNFEQETADNHFMQKTVRTAFDNEEPEIELPQVKDPFFVNRRDVLKRKRKREHIACSKPCVDEDDIDDYSDDESIDLHDFRTNKVTLGIVQKGKDRVYDKRNYCYFCETPSSKISRHLISNHIKEIEVSAIAALPPRSRERKLRLIKLLRLGNFYHNAEVLYKKQGTLVVLRRPDSDVLKTPYDFGPCPICLGFVGKKFLFKHQKTCPFKETVEIGKESERKPSRFEESKAIILPFLYKNVPNQFIIKILSGMSNDPISTVVENDRTIIDFGLLLYEKHGNEQKNLIRTQMREVARMLMSMRDLVNKPNILVIDCIKPELFDEVVRAVRLLCNQENNPSEPEKKNIPSLALKIGFHLKKICMILRGQALKHKDKILEKNAKAFLNIMTLEWNAKVSHRALLSLYSAKQNKPKALPLAEDLLTLNKYLREKMKNAASELENAPNSSNFLKLATLTLSRIILFNKRRGGEASRMTVAQLISRPNWNSAIGHELNKTLSDFEKNLKDKLVLVQITGKRNRHVPVLLLPDVYEAVRLLVQYRKEVGVASGNPYVFACANDNSLNSIRGPDCIRKVANEAGLKNPSAITSTGFRKHIATVTQVLSLEKKELGWLATHLGHDIQVHKEYYRIHESALELTQVSKLLLAAERGDIGNLKGKKLSEIEYEDISEDDESNLSDPDDVDVDSDEETNKKENYKASKSRSFFNKSKKANILDQDVYEKDEFCLTEQDILDENSDDQHNLKDRNEIPQSRIFVPNTKRGRTSNKGQQKSKRIAALSRKKWTKEQINKMYCYFKTNVKEDKVTSKKEVEKFKDKYSKDGFFDDRKWSDIKFWVYNRIQSLRIKKKVLKSEH